MPLDGSAPHCVDSHSVNLTIRWGFHDSPLGGVLIAVTPLGICSLQFADTPSERRAALARVHAEWPDATLHESTVPTRHVARAALGRQSGTAPLTLHVRGTRFQVLVWSALLRIPPGAVTTYAAVAAAIAEPRAVRAVGTAVGRNPVSVLIPCHRVLRTDGGLGGYAWGVERKERLLRRELELDGGR